MCGTSSVLSTVGGAAALSPLPFCLLHFLPIFPSDNSKQPSRWFGEHWICNAKEDKPKGFKSGNVKVFSSNDDGEWPPDNNERLQQHDDILQQAVEVAISDAETMGGTTLEEEEDGHVHRNSW